MEISSECYRCLEQSLRLAILTEVNLFFDPNYGFDIDQTKVKLQAYKYLKEKCTPKEDAPKINVFALLTLSRQFYAQN